MRPKSRQIRPIVDSDRPLRRAIEDRDQCVASPGSSSRVAMRTSSTWSSRIDGGRPGRCSSASPSSRLRVNRPRHRATVCSVTRSSAATALLSLPSAQASTIRARSARACEDFARRAQRVSLSRSAPVRTSPAFGRPGRGLSASPAAPDSANRSRHFRTVSAVRPSPAATPELPAGLPAPRRPARSEPAQPGAASLKPAAARAPHGPRQTAPAAQQEATQRQSTDLCR